MAASEDIALNFLEISTQQFQWDIYVKKVVNLEESNPSPVIRRYNLPENINNRDSEFVPYYVSNTPVDGFEQISIGPTLNNAITTNYLFKKLVAKCRQVFRESEDFTVEEDGFRKKVNLIIGKSEIGNEEIWVEPYYLSCSQKHGFLVGFHFSLAEGQPFNKSVQQKSLSLGPDGRENINYYSDIHKKIQHFILHLKPQIFPLENRIDIASTFSEIAIENLQQKKYIFRNDKTDSSQFQGIKKFGPLAKIDENSLICFMYRANDKPLSYELYHALRGEKYGTFPGMETMFSFSLGKEHVSGLPLNDYSEQTIAKSIESLKGMSENRPTLPLMLVPWSRLEHTDDNEDDYYRIKHQFLSAGIPTQFVSLQRMRAKDGLKWSISNIGLGVFSKLGGMPWKLQPRHEKCLIIGIGQAHRKQADGSIARYFAYSVLSDSSGLYDSIKILSKSEQKDSYLNGLTENIKKVIADRADKYDKFVIHTPFKLRKDEVEALVTGLKDVQDKEIVVLKFNEHSKFFGFALGNNSKVPFESSCIHLGKKQYLVWFEGLQYHNPVNRRRTAKPIHIEFSYCSKENLSHSEEMSYLQDAINLSGANWRGFNAKSSPVSVYYAKIIADYIGNFDRLALPEIDIENLPPWFL